MGDSGSPPALDTGTLGEFQMLAGVGLTARREMLDAGTERTLAPGEVLLELGTANAHMYLLVEGQLGIHLDAIDGEPVAIIEAGETVGELSLLDQSLTSANVVAVGRCRVLVLDEKTFWTLTNDSHAFAINLLVNLAERLRANNAKVSDNVRKRRRYERAAMFDGLTGIHNRRWLDETLTRLVARYRRSPGDMSVALLDVDKFKSFNDTYGHAAGDHVLTIVAATLGRNLRPTDLVARFGGEEFVIILPDTNLADAAQAAERVREAVATEPLTMPDGTELPSVTISIGVAQLTEDQPVPALLLAADQAMYRAKEAGRNRVELERPD